MRIWLGVGAAAALGAGLLALTTSTGRDSQYVPITATPASGVRLVSYHSCADLLAGLRQHAAHNVDSLVAPIGDVAFAAAAPLAAAPLAAARDAAGSSATAPQHSTTNDYVAGADEPDLVKTDGNRVITVENGVLQIVDSATKKVTGRLKLSGTAFGASNLLVDGDRALVILSGAMGLYESPSGGSMSVPPGGMPFESITRYVLVDLSGHPRVLGTLAPNGNYVDARLVNGVVRLVVVNRPNIRVPLPYGGKEQTARTRAAIYRAPLRAWLPTYQVTDGAGVTSSHTAGCGTVRHPTEYTGTSMLTIYSLNLAAGLKDTSPVSLAADGDTVYATTTSLYITSNPQMWAVPMSLPASRSTLVQPKLPPQQTQIHRFDISSPGAPRYMASGKVSGRLLNQYSLSDYKGYLRVATTSGYAVADEPGQSSAASTSSSSVYVLRADTLTKVGEVDGLGKRQRIYSVRFIGPVGYVVTFQQMDPLYTLDLRDPTGPRVAGSLELTGYSSYLHPASDGKLIGVGQEASTQGRPQGLLVSLFDVSNPSHPTRLAHLFKPNFESGAEWDPHAFLYWPQSGTAVLPVNSWTDGRFAASDIVLSVTESQITVRGTVTQPAGSAPDDSTRSLVIGDELWTVSGNGLMVSSLASLRQLAWIPIH